MQPYNQLVFDDGSMVTREESRFDLLDWIGPVGNWSFIQNVLMRFQPGQLIKRYRHHDGHTPWIKCHASGHEFAADHEYVALGSADQLRVFLLQPILPTWLFQSLITVTTLAILQGLVVLWKWFRSRQ